MKNMLRIIVSAGLVLAATAARAVNLVNADAAAHEITLDNGNKTSTINIPPSETIKSACNGCVVSLGDS